jgi:hypothetical protein
MNEVLSTASTHVLLHVGTSRAAAVKKLCSCSRHAHCTEREEQKTNRAGKSRIGPDDDLWARRRPRAHALLVGLQLASARHRVPTPLFCSRAALHRLEKKSPGSSDPRPRDVVLLLPGISAAPVAAGPRPLRQGVIRSPRHQDRRQGTPYAAFFAPTFQSGSWPDLRRIVAIVSGRPNRSRDRGGFFVSAVPTPWIVETSRE